MPDVGRRGFVRQLGRDALRTAAIFAEGAIGLRGALGGTGVEPSTTDGARELPPVAVAASPETPTLGSRLAAYRWDERAVTLVDRRTLPRSVTTIECRSGQAVLSAVREGVVTSAPVMAQLAAIALAMTARDARGTAAAKRFELEAVGTPLLYHRSSATAVAAAVARMMSRFDALADDSSTDASIADGMRAEARALIGQAAEDHRAVAAAIGAHLASMGSRPLQVMTLGDTGVMGGGAVGTCLDAVGDLHRGGRAVSVLIAGSSVSSTADVTAWELERTGVAHQVIPDAACGSAITSGAVDALLLTAESVRPDGSVLSDIGSRQIALVAREQGIPVIVAAPSTALVTSGPSSTGFAATQRTAPGLRASTFRIPVVEEVPVTAISVLVTSGEVSAVAAR